MLLLLIFLCETLKDTQSREKSMIFKALVKVQYY